MNNFFNQAFVEETPAKVMSLLAASLLCLSFLFAVTASEASFAGMQKTLPNPFAPEKVLAVVDTAAASYTAFLNQNLIEPLSADYALYWDNASFAFKESGLAYALGVENLLYGQKAQGQVAGAYMGSE